jgi:hypothetical protein
MTTDMPINGGCYCGAVRYESTRAPIRRGMCHCRMCQRWTGAAAVMGLLFDLDHFSFIRGEPRIFMTSPILERYFCADCGTSLGHHYVFGDNTGIAFICIGTLDHPEQFDGPQQHFGVESHLPGWIPLRDGVRQIRADTHEGNRKAWALAERQQPR